MSFPPFSEELRHLESHFTVAELKSIWYTVVEELTMGPMSMRKHGMKLYNLGCRGPVCRRANRVGRRIRTRSQPRKGALELDLVIEYYETVATQRRDRFLPTLQESLCNSILEL